MDVRCEKCAVEYDFDSAQLPEEGLQVECGTCGHRFRVSPGESNSGWQLKYPDGTIESVPELSTLQKLIVERKIKPDAQISRTGKRWRPINEIAELSSFFQISGSPELTQGASTGVGSEKGWESGESFFSDSLKSETPNDSFTSRETQYAEYYKKRRRKLILSAFVLCGVIALGAAAIFIRGGGALPEEFQVLFKPIEPEPTSEIVEPPLTPSPKEKGSELLPDDKIEQVALSENKPAPVPTPKPPEPKVKAEVVAPASPALVEKPSTAPTPANSALSVDELIKQADRNRERDRPNSAVALYEKVLSKDKNHFEAMAGIAWCLMDLKQFDRSIRMFNQVLAKEPTFGDAHMGLAEIYRFQGKLRAAKKHYRAYLDMSPNGSEAGFAKSMLRQLE